MDRFSHDVGHVVDFVEAIGVGIVQEVERVAPRR